jgi:hypothetical protein
MAVPRKIKLDCDEVFPYGAFVVSEVTPLRDFDRSTADNPVQAVDADNGERVWLVEVIDVDPDTRRSDRHLTVKLTGPVSPTLPALPSGFQDNFPFRPVEFTGLTGTPWVDDSGPRARLSWSLRATGMTTPKIGSKATAVPDSKAS